MARRNDKPNPDRDLFIDECMREYAKYFVVRGYEAPTEEAIVSRATIAGEYYDRVVAPYAASLPVEIGKK